MNHIRSGLHGIQNPDNEGKSKHPRVNTPSPEWIVLITSHIFIDV